VSEDLKILKQRIYDEGKIEVLLEELGCESIKSEQSGSLITASHDGWNKRAVQVKNNLALTSYIRNRGIEGDIFSIVGFMLYECETFEDVRTHLHQIKTWICNTLSYDDLLNQRYEKPEPKVDWNSWLRPIQQLREKNLEITENRIVDERLLNLFVPYPHKIWIDDGLQIKTLKNFKVGFDVNSERITIPVHNKDGQLIGVKGRYCGNNPSIMDEQKYNYIVPCSKSIELFNLHRALPYIQDSKEVIVVEGAKTTMFLWDWGFRNVVSIEGDRLSPVQAKLLKDTGLDVDLVFAWDKDKSADFIKQQTRQIKNRNKFVIWDSKGLLTGKDSPCDKGREVFVKLYEDRKRHKLRN
jgi:DNA primase